MTGTVIPAKKARLTKAPLQISSSSIALRIIFLLFDGSDIILAGQRKNTAYILLIENDNGFVKMIIKGIYITAITSSKYGLKVKDKIKKCIPIITIEISKMVITNILKILSGIKRINTQSG